jgi:hypothetical protein
VAKEKMLWKELHVAQGKIKLVILQTTNDWENMAIENKTKAMLYDKLIEQFPMEMGELLEEAIIEFKRWHFEQIGKYTSALNAAYENIRQLEGKYEEEKTNEVVSEEATREEVKQASLLEKDEDETTPIRKLIRKQEVVDPIGTNKVKEQKVENKDHVTSMDGEWVETIMKKLIYGVVAPRVEHPTLVEKASVIFQK